MNKTEQSNVHVSANGIHAKNTIDAKVFTTSNYEDFKRITGNRTVNVSHVNKLKESMIKSDLMIPIVVNEKMEVIDGQHRLQARREAKLPVPYVMVKGLSIEDTQKANSNNKNWGGEDFLNYYCERNYFHYKTLKKFINTWKFTFWGSMALLGDAGIRNNSFRDGQFAVKDENKGNEMAEKICQLQPYYKGFKRQSFVLTMIKLLNNPEFEFEEFLQKLSYQSSKLVNCTTIDQYLDLLEDIYNFKRASKDRVRFK